MLTFEYFDHNRPELLVTFRIVPAFLTDGVRVFRKRSWEREELWCFNERVFESEAQAAAEITKMLNIFVISGITNTYTAKRG